MLADRKLINHGNDAKQNHTADPKMAAFDILAPK